MSVKYDVLKLLEENKGNFISGEKTASLLGISRTAVWKAIRSLQNDGYLIEAVTNKGYTLKEESNILSKEGIELFLKKKVPLNLFPVVDSTNKKACALALDGAPHGTCVLSQCQTKGRGRLGRSFYSPDKGGIYLSVIIKPSFDISKSVLITAGAAVAVMRAIESVCGIHCKIKWVNDVYIDDKKVCGILTEAITDFESGQITSVIVGIGINCAVENFTDDIKDVAANIPGNFSINHLTAEVINQLLSISENIQSRDFIKEYRNCSMLIGKRVNVIKASQEPVEALVKGIDDDGGLIVTFDNRDKETLTTGEVSIRLK